MSDRTGFFSSMGRLFSGTKRSKESDKSNPSSPSKESSSSSSRSPGLGTSLFNDIVSADKNESVTKKSGNNLRYLSPSALDPSSREKEKADESLNGLGMGVDPASDIFSTPNFSTGRKRQLTETDRIFLPQSFRSDSVKRSRVLNRSLMEPTLRSSIGSQKLDATWCGEFSARNSPASSVSNYSLLTRRSETNSNGSLSSRTQKIFKKLETASTPAKEIQRMSMIRSGAGRPEKWASNSSTNSSEAPPLRKAGECMPSRIQLLSKQMPISAQKKPYWRDLTRRRSDPKTSEQSDESVVSKKSTTNGSVVSTELSSLFSNLDNQSSKKSDSVSSAPAPKKHHSALKGSDGKAVGKNTFKLIDDGEDIQPAPEQWLLNAKPLVLGSNAAPEKGFLGNLSFKFAAPIDLVSSGSAQPDSKSSSTSDNDSSDERTSEPPKETATTESSESSSSESEDSADEVENTTKAPPQSRPQTSTDTVSPGISVSSSKDSSPKTVTPSTEVVVSAPVKAAANWECDGCFTSWPATSNECGCCGQVRGGTAAKAPAEKQLVSNLASFVPKSTTATFGFGASAPSMPSKPVAFGTGSATPAPSLFGSLSKPIDSVQSVSTTKAVVPPTLPIQPLAPIAESTPSIPVSTAPSTLTAVVPPPTTTTKATKERVDWQCRECFVSNKAENSRCVCCEYVEYPDETTSSNVFGNRAFKPNVGASNITFGTAKTGTQAAPMFGFGSSTKETPSSSAFGTTANASKTVDSAPPTTAPVASNTEKAAPLFGGIVPSIPNEVPKSKETTTSVFNASAPLFGSTNVFGTKPAEPASNAQPSIIATSSELPKTGLFGSSLSNTLTTETKKDEKTIPFGNPLAKPFGSGSIFGEKPATSAAPTATTHVFGQLSDSSKSTSIFGSNSPIVSSAPSTAPTVAAAIPSSGPTTNLFGSGSTNLFGTSKDSSTTLFGKPAPTFGNNDIGTTTTDGAPLSKRPLFPSMDAAPLSFGKPATEKPAQSSTVTPAPFSVFGSSGSNNTAAPSTGLFGTTAPTFGGFGSSSSTSNLPAFGSTSTASSTAPAPFGSTLNATSPFGSTSSAPFGSSSTFGNTTNPFSSSTAAPSFGSTNAGAPTFGSNTFGSSAPTFGSQPSMVPAISNSSSTSSLFNNTTTADPSSNPFGSTSNNGFQFGSNAPSANASNGGVFVFGNSAAPPIPTTQNGPAFQFGNNGAPGGMDNAFSYQPSSQSSAGARKMALARRRNPRR